MFNHFEPAVFIGDVVDRGANIDSEGANVRKMCELMEDCPFDGFAEEFPVGGYCWVEGWAARAYGVKEVLIAEEAEVTHVRVGCGKIVFVRWIRCIDRSGGLRCWRSEQHGKGVVSKALNGVTDTEARGWRGSHGVRCWSGSFLGWPKVKAREYATG